MKREFIKNEETTILFMQLKIEKLINQFKYLSYIKLMKTNLNEVPTLKNNSAEIDHYLGREPVLSKHHVWPY